DPNHTTMRTGRFRWWRILLLAVVAVVGVVFAGSWVILRVYGPAFTRERVEALLEEALGQPAHVGAVRLVPWRGRLSIADVDMPRGRRDGVLARAAAIDVSVDIASLWRREFILSAVATDLHLDATVPKTETAGPNLFPLPPYFPVGPLRIGIGSIRVK